MSNPDIPFEPLFFFLDNHKNHLRSIAVQKKENGIYKGVSFKECANGWEVNPISVGEHFINAAGYDYTTNIEEAIKHASNK